VEERFRAALADLEGVLALSAKWVDPASLFHHGNPDTDWFVLATTEQAHRLGREWVTKNLDQMHPAVQEFLGQGLAVTIEEYLAARRRRFGHVRDLDLLLGHGTVIATPTVASTGWLRDGRMSPEGRPGMVPPEVYNTAAQNVTGHPAISLPAGRCGNGVPFGLQLTGPRFRDDLLLDVAELWGQVHRWPPLAPGYDPFPSALGLF
jgi:Asp-tRNA(Asn)/Glu-tRNA(Gln) amidotransferase A subunit family amidase